ncbi:MAG: hypothetical protein HC934_08930 [Acaryochloridaceae cyanobacterium SU_2_1]|nr:hypothetical protein [Acaryochloridaceae cyanobacterium SU_2_1]
MIASADIVTMPLKAAPGLSVAAAVELLYNSQDRWLAILEGQSLKGWVGDRQIMQALGRGLDLESTPVQVIMSQPPICLSAAETYELERLAQQMPPQDSQPLALVDASAQLVGMITLETLVQQLILSQAEHQQSLDQAQQRLEDLQHQVSDRTLLEAKLRSSEGRIRAVFEAMEDLVFVCDVESGKIGNIEVAPTNFSEAGEADVDLISPTIDQLWQDPEQRWSAIIQQAVETQQTVNFDYQLTIGNRPLWFTASVSPLLHQSVVWVARNITEQKESVVWVARNITERKQFESELAKLNQELLRSNQELEQFAYVASHDLQEPLRMVISFTQLLSQNYQGQLDEQADQMISFAVDGATRMQRLIQDLLSYSRVGTHSQSPEKVDCNQIVEVAIANLQAAIQESGAVLKVDPLPTIVNQPLLLTQLFQNLIGNALKYRGENPPVVTIGHQPQADQILIWVKDNGIGIEAQHADRIFMVFQRLHTRQHYSGTGIGLAICKKIVEQQGGKIWVESQINEGSTFFFTLAAELALSPDQEK